MISQANGIPKQAGVTILISDKADFKPNLVKRDKDDHSILINGTIHQKDITIINIYVHPILLNTIRHKGTEEFRYNISDYNRDFNTHSHQDIDIQMKKVNKETRVKLYHRANGLSRHPQNIPPNKCRIYIFLSSPWSVLQSR
jgi:hypothetical protein